MMEHTKKHTFPTIVIELACIVCMRSGVEEAMVNHVEKECDHSASLALFGIKYL